MSQELSPSSQEIKVLILVMNLVGHTRDSGGTYLTQTCANQFQNKVFKISKHTEKICKARRITEKPPVSKSKEE